MRSSPVDATTHLGSHRSESARFSGESIPVRRQAHLGAPNQSAARDDEAAREHLVAFTLLSWSRFPSDERLVDLEPSPASDTTVHRHLISGAQFDEISHHQRRCGDLLFGTVADDASGWCGEHPSRSRVHLARSS